MPRIKVQVDRHAYQTEIDRIERKGPLKNHKALFKAVSDGAWGKANGITVAVATSRYFEFRLRSKTKAGRITEVAKARDAGVKPEAVQEEPEPDYEEPEPVKAKPRKRLEPVKLGRVDGDFFEPFTRRGIAPESLEDLVASVSKSDAENIAIIEAWREVTQRVHGRMPRKEQLIGMYDREGLAVPRWVMQLVERGPNGQEIPRGSDTSIHPRVEFVK